jgi:hypothetical protein
MKGKVVLLILLASGFNSFGADLIKKIVFWTIVNDGTTVKSYAWLDGEGSYLLSYAMAYGIDMNVTGFSHKYQVSEKKHGTGDQQIRDIRETLITEFNLSSWTPGEVRNLQAQIKYTIKDGGLTLSGLGFQISLGQGEDAYTENNNSVELTKPCPEEE